MYRNRSEFKILGIAYNYYTYIKIYYFFFYYYKRTVLTSRRSSPTHERPNTHTHAHNPFRPVATADHRCPATRPPRNVGGERFCAARSCPGPRTGVAAVDSGFSFSAPGLVACEIHVVRPRLLTTRHRVRRALLARMC